MEARRVVVIGGGAAGMTAAYFAAKNSCLVTLLEKNEKLGKKIYITGKGRCNFTNAVSPDEFLQNVVSNPRFLTGAIHAFSPDDVMRFFEDGGLAIKTERGNRVFPASDHASDVTKTLEHLLQTRHVTVKLGETVRSVRKISKPTSGIVLNSNPMFDIITDLGGYAADAVIIATGGLAYPSTGSTGDGYRFAQAFGHSLVPCVPALCGIETAEGEDRAELQGVSLKNVRLSALRSGKEIASFFGEMLFTHYGISGPCVLSLSSRVNRIPASELRLALDLKPALTERQTEDRLLREFSLAPNRSLFGILTNLLPRALIASTLRRAKIDPAKPVHSVTKEERKRLISTLKCYIIIPTALRPFEEAVITAGGVSVREINPKSMESRLVPGLYFCGEVLDVDAYTGGFNLQIAFATGYAAGNAAAKEKA